jgi:hypothetical protein
MRKDEFAPTLRSQASGAAPKFDGASDIQEIEVSGARPDAAGKLMTPALARATSEDARSPIPSRFVR